MRFILTLSCCLSLLPFAYAEESSAEWQPDAKALAEYKKLCNEQRQWHLQSTKQDIRDLKMKVGQMRRARIGVKNMSEDGVYVSFASESNKKHFLKEAMAEVEKEEARMKRMRDKKQPFFATTDYVVGEEYAAEASVPYQVLKQGLIFHMSQPKCKVIKVIDSDTAIVAVNWYISLGGGEVDSQTTNILLRKRPTEGLVDEGTVLLDSPLYVATTESYRGKTMFVLVPVDTEALFPEVEK